MTFDGLDASAVTDDDLDAIATGLAELMDGVTASHISNVAVTDASSRRHRGRRSLLGTAATVSFTVSVSLAETSFTDASDLLSTVSTTMTEVESDSSALVSEIKAAASSDSKWDDVTGVSGTTTAVVTRAPTSAPTLVPSPVPTVEAAGGSGPEAANVDVWIGLGCGFGFLLLVAVVVWQWRRNKDKKKKKRYNRGEEERGETEASMSIDLESGPMGVETSTQPNKLLLLGDAPEAPHRGSTDLVMPPPAQPTEDAYAGIGNAMVSANFGEETVLGEDPSTQPSPQHPTKRASITHPLPHAPPSPDALLDMALTPPLPPGALLDGGQITTGTAGPSTTQLWDLDEGHKTAGSAGSYTTQL